MTLANPMALYLLFLLPLLAWWQIKQRRYSGLTYSSLSLIAESSRSWRQRLLFVPVLMQYTALTLIIFCLSRPQTQINNVRQDREGIAIEIVVDISTSMDFSMNYNGEDVTRMKVAKNVVKEFVTGNDKLKGRPDDLIGLITFARYPDTISPVTQNHDALVSMIEDLTINDRPNEDGTAYGDATALAAARLADLSTRDETENITSKVIILLTDGENNSGKKQPMQAAALAKKWGIKIYTISIKSAPKDQVVMTEGTQVHTLADLSPSDQVLKKMANMTGGVFRSAFDYDSLSKVYQEIDRLEKSKLKATVFKEKDEAFKIFLLAAILLLLLQKLLNSTIFRTTP